MKFEIGYSLPREGESSLVDIVREHLPHVAEVYFAWVDVPSGRAPLPTEGRSRLEADLKALRGMGVSLNLLFNASCYGAEAFSRDLASRASAVLEHLHGLVGLDTVTTMSPLIASLVHQRAPGVRVRASVNMRLGTVAAFEQSAGLFDGYMMQREHNRDLARIEELSSWCRREGKTLHILASSACLPWCAVQTFHDNLVAHERELDPSDAYADHIPGSCHETYRDRCQWARFLDSTWIRPEDVHHYEPWFAQMKLATRMHASPRRVLRAYAEGRFAGNLAELMEPGLARAFTPFVWDNGRFPADWFDRVTAAGSAESRRAYCEEVMRRVLVNTSAAEASLEQRMETP